MLSNADILEQARQIKALNNDPKATEMLDDIKDSMEKAIVEALVAGKSDVFIAGNRFEDCTAMGFTGVFQPFANKTRVNLPAL